MKNKKITVLGIGNLLYSDEGVGIHILPLLEERLAQYEDVEVVEGSTDGMRLLGTIEETEYLVVVDAVNAGKEAGTIITLVDDEIPAYFGMKMSIHQLGFQEVLLAAKLRQTIPKQMVLFGVQPASLVLGLDLSPIVQAQLPYVVERVVRQIEEWCHTP
ncbi:MULTISPECIES: HyaD/HybD family hydrogenase maturation endopeptidase [Anoxybacillus]|jgi:hydrogenase maturation protease|uniref:Hydrogenase maturation protease n=1 Tax=Anoxybacillus flavithermus AK1 TaxID=1297581 RepID=M8CWQ1_9BACL|nr:MULTISPECIES: HyaD/HybD family hydrogenase maturation endopeptidase [Anoxybacillus]EMT45948.1 hydrogenase maturation protease [Anoxybacillus flavithermus AK1]MBE2944286.1 HyaD/HybD family hydrogenase maturation endopeptidase [Anoxybacillus flavithermus]MBE2951052.1 HyaD/HybD family hydrogenase maturation endopeptidase [Anoxybacillus flavithermus]MBE2953685.1 HyaD/HybD family hydrogenase maturation endopeptidase [Anoxybacillus flavithermus]MBE2959014.1 HyaD/HybD family hydrogenase maturation